ncbi:MAG TPA: hypothetical protein VKZ75_04315 [Cyclobacteriaceae bacterium]|nr:hypothetical protein [Cyclobacteriaceae bacterium]
MSIRTCLECGERVTGRLDKKFCSDLCRVSYNNRLNAPAIRYVKNVTHALMRNRRVLLALNPTGKCRVSEEQLLQKGFDFRYFTSQYTTRGGAVYRYCFEQGYLKMDNHAYLLVVKKEL